MLKDILLKEYDAMRNEIRMYINKYYIAITLIYTILSAGLLKIDPSQGSGIIYIWIPYIIAAIIGFMTMITFFVSKTAGYIRLIEYRVSKLFGTVPPVLKSPIEEKILLAPMFWESTYADISHNRDKGRQFTSPFFISVLVMFISGIVALGIIMYFGYQVASKHTFMLTLNGGYVYLITSILLLGMAISLFPIVNTYIRRKTIEVNETFITKFKLMEIDELNDKNHGPSTKLDGSSRDIDDDEDLIDSITT